MSKILPTFATVNSLERHIEILLLSNDCVIVPGLGGFVAHHVCARYVPEEGIFLPPLRTVGFNAQLTMNDSLLAQAYAEAADTSLPDALDAIEREVADLRATLDDTGEVEMPSLGRLYKTDEGHLAFDPCEAGILTPSLYGLSSFEIRQIAEAASAQSCVSLKSGVSLISGVSDKSDISDVSDKKRRLHVSDKSDISEKSDKSDKPEKPESPASPDTTEQPAVYISHDSRGRKALSISLRALRNTAAAAAVIAAMFLVPAPLAPDGSQQADISSNAMVGRLKDAVNQFLTSQQTAPLMAQQDTVRLRKAKPVRKAKPTKKVAPAVTKAKAAVAPTLQKTAQQAPATPTNQTNRKNPINQITPSTPTTQKPVAQKGYSIVLCSHVSQQGAQAFVQKLAKEGVSGAQVSNTNGATKVLYGRYATEADARKALNGLRSNANFQQAWVLAVK